MTITVEFNKTSLWVFISFVGFITIMSWIKVLNNRMNCSKRKGRLGRNCPSFLSEATWGVVTIGVTVAAFIGVVWAYRNSSTVIDEDPCTALGLSDPLCDVETFCWNPPDLYKNTCSQHCKTEAYKYRDKFENDDCLIYYCETDLALVSNPDKFWVDGTPENKLMEDCYDICLRRVEDNTTSTCAKLICSKEVSPEEPEEVTDYCVNYCNFGREFYPECYVRTCEGESGGKCECKAYIDCVSDTKCETELSVCNADPRNNKEECKQLFDICVNNCQAQYDEMCEMYCNDKPYDNLCNQVECLKDPYFGCNPCTGELCQIADGPQSLRHPFTGVWVYEYGNPLRTDAVNSSTYQFRAFTDGSDTFLIHEPDNKTNVLKIHPTSSKAYFEEASESEGERFLAISTGIEYEFYFKTERYFNTGAGTRGQRYLGLVCDTVGLVPAPSNDRMANVKWRFGPPSP